MNNDDPYGVPLNAALAYAGLGLRVFPLHNCDAEGRCSCERGEDCPQPGEHPRVDQWGEQATSDEMTIRQWWEQWPDSNLAATTGDESGVLMLHISNSRGGHHTLSQLEDQYSYSFLRHPAICHPNGDHVIVLKAFEFSIVGTLTVGNGLDLSGNDKWIPVPPSSVRGQDGEVRGLYWRDFAGPTQYRFQSAPGWFGEIVRNKRQDLLERKAVDPILRINNHAHTEIGLEDIQTLWVQRSQNGGTREMTEMSLAEFINALNADNYRFVAEESLWLHWNNAQWEPDQKKMALRLDIKNALHGIRLKASQEGNRTLEEKCSQMERASRFEGVTRQAEIVFPRITRGELNCHPWLLNVSNGTVDLKSGELLSHRRDHYLTQIARVEYDPNATAPMWEGFLETVFSGNTDLTRYVQQAIGYSLSGSVSERVFFILYGTGSNGKSTFLETLRKILGDYIWTLTSDALIRQNNPLHPTHIAQMRGRRFVYTQELPNGARLNESLLKTLTGGDTTSPRLMHQDAQNIAPTWKMWLSTNHLPVIDARDKAMWDRVKVIQIIHRFERENSADRGEMIDRLVSQEGPGILRWAVDGCLHYLHQRLKIEPHAVSSATMAYRNKMDPIGRFIEDRCLDNRLDPSCWVFFSDLYEAFVSWCEDSGEPTMDARQLGGRLTLLGYPTKKIRGINLMGESKEGKARIGIQLADANSAVTA